MNTPATSPWTVWSRVLSVGPRPAIEHWVAVATVPDEQAAQADIRERLDACARVHLRAEFLPLPSGIYPVPIQQVGR